MGKITWGRSEAKGHPYVELPSKYPISPLTFSENFYFIFLCDLVILLVEINLYLTILWHLSNFHTMIKPYLHSLI